MTSRRPTILAGLLLGLLSIVGCGRASSPTAVAPRVAALAPAAPTKARAPAPAKVEAAAPKLAGPSKPRLRLSPSRAILRPGDPGLQMVVEGDGPRGGQRDLTGDVRWEAEPSGIVAVGPDGYVTAVSEGKAVVRATRGKDRTEAEVVVAGEDRAWDFGADIVPILSRFGCNTGGCHGKADGQNGFHLSLFGYDPEGDYRNLTRQGGGRRLDPMDPDASLFLQKAAGRVPHGGGLRVGPNSEEYRTLLAWIKAGAPERSGRTHGALTSVTVEPREIRLDEPGAQQLRVVAHYADGHDRDVTRLATYKVNDDNAAEVQERGLARLLKRAEVDLVVRYQSNVLAIRIATIINPDLKFDFAKLPRRNVIDDELYKRLEALKVPPSPPASDAAFLRRASLDLTGEVPQTQEVRDFIKDTDPDKRAKLVDRLMKSRRFLQFWEIKLGDMLQLSPNRFGAGYGPYEFWLRDSLAKNAPWDRMVRELLTSVGETAKGGLSDPGIGAANYALDGPDAKVKAEQAAQRFLGLRMRCAQCHDHLFDIWTQDDYFGLAAFFAKTGIDGPPAPGAMMGATKVRVNPLGSVEHLRTKQPARPKLPGGAPLRDRERDRLLASIVGSAVRPADHAASLAVALSQVSFLFEDPRLALADWMTSPENPYFARAMANWAWAQFFGKGIADPPDDLSKANPPVHPELLDALARHFVEHEYDLRDLIRTVATSNAYAASSSAVPGNERDTRLFSHHLPRPLTAHQMADALAEITQVPNVYGQLGPKLAIEVNNPTVPSTILDTFGRCQRTSGCSAVATPSLSLRQMLLLIGGDVVDGKVTSLNGYLSSLLSLDLSPGETVENLYFRTLCRPPTDREKGHWAKMIEAAPNPHEAAEDLFWALLNSREFAFNH